MTVTEDIIYRARMAAIDDWKNDFKEYVNTLNIPRDDYNEIMAYIEESPLAQQWIPVTVKLPDESGTYLVTISYKNGSSDDTDLIWYSSHWREWNEGELSGGKVIAWQPKPKPWKGRHDDT